MEQAYNLQNAYTWMIIYLKKIIHDVYYSIQINKDTFALILQFLLHICKNKHDNNLFY